MTEVCALLNVILVIIIIINIIILTQSTTCIIISSVLLCVIQSEKKTLTCVRFACRFYVAKRNLISSGVNQPR